MIAWSRASTTSSAPAESPKELEKMKGTRGPAGFPADTLIMGLILAQYYRKSTNISVAWAA
jgi:hypothetical protein